MTIDKKSMAPGAVSAIFFCLLIVGALFLSRAFGSSLQDSQPGNLSANTTPEAP